MSDEAQEVGCTNQTIDCLAVAKGSVHPVAVQREH